MKKDHKKSLIRGKKNILLKSSESIETIKFPSEERLSKSPLKKMGTKVADYKHIGDYLVQQHFMTPDHLNVALWEQRRTRKSLEVILVELGFVTEAHMTALIGAHSGYGSISLKESILDPLVVNRIPRGVAEAYKVIPVFYEKDHLEMAMVDVYNIHALDEVRRYFPPSLKITPLLCTEGDYLAALEDYYGKDFSIDGLLAEILKMSQGKMEDKITEDPIANPTARLIMVFILDAIRADASDIHFEPEGAFVRVRYRIDGVLISIKLFHAECWPMINVRLKIMAAMNIAQSRRPQNGRFTIRLGLQAIDFRVSSHPISLENGQCSENIVLRILNKSRSLVPLDQLGYNDFCIPPLKRALQRSTGLIIITGPTGSGKTTTLYSMLSYINDDTLNIMTLEEPVEYQIPFIRQSEVREEGMSFSDGIRSILRQDPDVILVGEIRDTGTAQMALRAAMTGHQVYTTLHTNDVFGAVPRLLDLGISAPLLAGNINCIINQRLLRVLCSQCKQQHLTPLGVYEAFKQMIPEFSWHPVGCASCHHTGYKGRTAIAEVLYFTENLEEIIFQGAGRFQQRSLAEEEGFIPLAQDALERLKIGQTSLEEVLRCVDFGTALYGNKALNQGTSL